jgi:hypothetical protein
MKGDGEPFLKRVKNLLFHPRREWEIIKEEQTSYQRLISSYLGIIAAIPPAAAVAERVLFDRGIAGSSPLGYVVAANILWYFVIIVNVLITAAVITAVACKDETGWISLKGFKLAVYSFTPTFLVCILMIIPRLNWFIYASILYSLYLLYLGIRSMAGVEQGKAAWYAAASVLASGLIVGVMNMFEYLLESFIASKIAF